MKMIKEGWTKKADSCVLNFDYRCALISLHLLVQSSHDSAYNERLNSKIDSIKPMARKNHLKSIQGKWKLVEFGSNWGYNKAENDTLILIDDSSISYYLPNSHFKEKGLIRKEKLIYSDAISLYPIFFNFKYSDGTLWNIDISEKNRLQMTYTGNEENNERSIIVCGNSEYYFKKVK
jgi:hypothetical protein